jgi:hydroxymethylpyrimidine pyrophosphatase-like HAD family hydrolase
MMNKNNKFVLAVDFDGTIVDHEYPNIGKLKPYAKEIINKLYKEGHTIIIWTCRSNAHKDFDDLNDMYYFLKSNKIKFHKINKNANCVKFGCFPKIYADYYIDDRNLLATDDWKLMYEIIQDKLKKRLREEKLCIK